MPILRRYPIFVGRRSLPSARVQHEHHLGYPSQQRCRRRGQNYTVQASRLSVAKCQNFPIDLRCQALVSLQNLPSQASAVRYGRFVASSICGRLGRNRSIGNSRAANLRATFKLSVSQRTQGFPAAHPGAETIHVEIDDRRGVKR
jgi:hypothetical protein